MSLNKILFLIADIFIAGSFVFGQDIRLVEKIPVSQKDALIEGVDGIAVLSDGSFIICDARAGDFRIYDNKGKFLKIFGRRGNGPNEFSSPRLLDYSENKLLVSDWGKSRIIIYQIHNALEWKEIEEFLGTCFDAKIRSDDYLLAGPKVDKKGRGYLLYLEKSEKEERSFLLTIEEIFNMASRDSLISGRNKLAENAALGTRAYCDYSGDNVYSIWEAGLSIIQLNIKTMKIMRFGEKTAMYRTPKITEKLINSKKTRNTQEYLSETNKHSMIRKIFVANNFIGVVYMNYFDDIEMWKPVVQLYSLDGQYISETKLDDPTYSHRFMPLYYDKNNNYLYALSMTIDEEAETHYTLLKYGIR